MVPPERGGGAELAESRRCGSPRSEGLGQKILWLWVLPIVQMGRLRRVQSWEGLCLWLQRKQSLTLGSWVHWPPVPSEPHPAGLGTALAVLNRPGLLGDKKRPRPVLQPKVFGLDVRGTSQQGKYHPGSICGGAEPAGLSSARRGRKEIPPVCTCYPPRPLLSQKLGPGI